MFERIYIKGNPYERGFQLGKKTKNKIKNTIDFNIYKMENLFNIKWNEIKSYSKKYLDYLNSNYPEYISEMKGIAEGAQLDFEDILAINCRYELSRTGTKISNECTTFAINGSKTSDGKTYICENWDWATIQKDNCLILEIEYENKHKITCFTEAGILSRMGVNNKGICFVGNTIKSDYVGMGLPVHLAMRKTLECNNMKELKSFIIKSKIASSFNFMVGDKDEILDFEVDNNQVSIIEPERGILIHTNNFVSKHLRNKTEYIKYEKEESLIRFESCNRLINSTDKLNISNIMDILRSHDNHPYGVCTHFKDGDVDYKKWSTVTSIIFCLNDNKFYISYGNPCENPYMEINYEC